MTRDTLVPDVRRALGDPKKLAERLGLKLRPTPTGGMICCPVHAEKTPSCSLRKTDTGVGVRCFGCGWTGDALHLVAAVEGLQIRNFREVLARACELAGMPDEARDVRGGAPAPPRAARPVMQPAPERDYPPTAELEIFWSACVPVTEDPEVTGLLAGRGIDPHRVASDDAARALRPETHWSSVPPWARYRGQREAAEPWTRTGHRLILPAFNALGERRSVRAWRVSGSDPAKRLPPSGCRASGLVIANRVAVRMLRGAVMPRMVVICEGEPDALVRSIVNPDLAVLGLISGSWSTEFAARVPFGCEVVVRTHLDRAGEQYAEQVIGTLSGRARVRRLTANEEAA
jgi:hypothetical protein